MIGPLPKSSFPPVFRLALLVCSLVTWGLVFSCSGASAASSGVLAWGTNGTGELGDGTNTGPEDCYPGFPAPCSLVPVPVSGLSGAQSVAAGATSNLALLSGGTVVSWGDNSYGQLGDGTTNGPETCESGDGQRGFPCSTVPVAVSGLDEVVAIAASTDYSLALLKDGTVMAWGSNVYGHLGNKVDSNSDMPIAIGGLSEVTAIAAASTYSLALLKNGTVMAWGSNDYGQLGDGTTTLSVVPVTVSGLSEVAAIAAGGETSFALLKDGTVMAWGANNVGQLGDGTSTGPETCAGTAACSRTPVAINGIDEATSIAAGSDPFEGPGLGLAVLKDGTVMAWGSNERGELGDGTETNSDMPVAVCAIGEQAPCAQHLSNVTAIAGGAGHNLALLADGMVVAWGSSYLGELGDGSQDVTPSHGIVGSDVPVVVDGLSEATAISAGGRLSFAFGTLALLPTVTGLDPGFGRTDGGTSVRITGTNFTGVTAVRFGSTAAGFTVDSETEITAVAPSGAGMEYVTLPGAILTPPGTVYVTVQTAAGTSPASASGDVFAYGALETEDPTGSGGDQSNESGGASTESEGLVFGLNTPISPIEQSITPKVLTRAQRLAQALKQCEKHKPKTKRVACEKRAHREYATAARKVSKQKRRNAPTGLRSRASQ